jgi:NADH-quinone oxidoreductase subunit M
MDANVAAQATATAFPWLSLITFLPLLGALALTSVPRVHETLLKGLALGWSIVVFLISLGVYTSFEKGNPDFQLTETHEWITSFGIKYAVGVDGISLFLVLLSTFLTPIILLGSWTAIEKRVKEFLICFLVLETAMIGALVALDIFLFYVFWELMLIPMYLLIGVWGGSNRIAATIKFFLMTAVGSLLMLVAIFYLYFKRPGDAPPSMMLSDYIGLDLTKTEQLWLFAAFALAFAIKVPMVPFHTWLPRAHTEAPTAGSVVLAGVLLKMGTYGFVRFAMPLFPEAVTEAIPYIAGLATFGIVYGALLALAQNDVKKLVAYSSVSHLGFVMLGLASLSVAGVQGGMLQMLNHGISTGALFLLVGVIYERRHTRQMADFGGITKVMPWFAVMFMVVTLSSIGLPGTNGFVGEFLVFVGAFTAKGDFDLRWHVAVAATGVILGAFYMLWMFQRVMFGPLTNEKNKTLKDLNLREWVVMLPLIVAIFVMGVKPQFMLERMEPSVEKFIAQVKSPKATTTTATTTGRGTIGTIGSSGSTASTTTTGSGTRTTLPVPNLKNLGAPIKPVQVIKPNLPADDHAGHGHGPGEAH